MPGIVRVTGPFRALGKRDARGPIRSPAGAADTRRGPEGAMAEFFRLLMECSAETGEYRFAGAARPRGMIRPLCYCISIALQASSIFMSQADLKSFLASSFRLSLR
jgi:hypothetical protein